jgi:hypothetical protein
LVLGDTPVSGATFIKAEIPQSEKWGCYFKFTFLERYLKTLDYDYLVWLDAENYFVRKPQITIEQLMQGSPIHTFLECDMVPATNARKEWWGCPSDQLIKFYRDQGVVSKKIYNVNGGFFAIMRSFIPQFTRLAFGFKDYCARHGYTFVDEVPLSYVTHLCCGDVELHTLDKFSDIWGCDWTDNYVDKLPDGREWMATNYMTNQKHLVNPDVVHAMRCKTIMEQ